MSNPQYGDGSNGNNGGREWHAPPAYTAQAQRITLLHGTVGYGTMEPSSKCRAPPSPGERIGVIVIYILVGILIGYMLQTPLDSIYRESQRSQWAIDKQNHTDEQQKWQKWVSDRDAEQRRWDEELAQKRGQIEWQGLQRQKCVRYGTSEYTATLSHVPLGLNPVDECRSKSLRINGRDLLPTRCEDQGYCGKITAHWEVDFNEPQCAPFFSEVLDKGCNGAYRRYDARLENIQEWETWREVCSTMTTAYGSVQLGPGASCSECNWGRCGRWATWMIQDYRCS
ncbi:hypothetical protein HYPSUDRAFT_41372 [Hypholoma sublateritium FD-334 SS-4]|uniref:Uncharacterized protein n=1 Tax=Hypholoma sublateritium (strain FD-334 SS-4) TaxID=945553 RepID=A0A0D2MF59_HYPSF|nr:hypothetical protein HYPSUDRAFT_41372 [Hypholoma sublateritium FD-334 SS-4]